MTTGTSGLDRPSSVDREAASDAEQPDAGADGASRRHPAEAWRWRLVSIRAPAPQLIRGVRRAFGREPSEDVIGGSAISGWGRY